MDTVKSVLTDYGAAIGPALAFLLAGLGVLIKYEFDRGFARRTAHRQLKNLKRLILDNPPPPELLTAEDSRTLKVRLKMTANIARFYGRLLAIRPLLARVEATLTEAGTLEDIEHFGQIKWWFDITLKEVERVRSSDDVSASDYTRAREVWEDLARSCRAGPQDWDYA